MALITWTDKTDATVSGLPESQKVTAATMAELKSVINTNAGLISDNENDIFSLEQRAGATPATYDYLSATTATDPGNGKFKLNHSVPSLSTHIYISASEEFRDISSLFDLLVVDSLIYIQDRVSNSISGIFKFVSIVDNTTWFDITMTVESVALAFSTSNFHSVSFYIKAATGAGSGTVTSVTTGNGLTQTGVSTVNPNLLVDYTSVLNLVLSASTDNSISTGDEILWNDVLTNTVHRTELNNLPAPDLQAVTDAGNDTTQRIEADGFDVGGTDATISYTSGTGKLDINTDGNMELTASTGEASVQLNIAGVYINSSNTNTHFAAFNTDDLTAQRKFSFQDKEGYFALTNDPESIMFAVSDEDTDLETGTAKITFRMPYAFTLTAVRANVKTAPTGSVLTVDINESGSTILSTKITIDATEKTSTTAATAPVISDTSLADDAEITVDIDGIGSTIAGTGLKVTLIGYKT